MARKAKKQISVQVEEPIRSAEKQEQLDKQSVVMAKIVLDSMELHGQPYGIAVLTDRGFETFYLKVEDGKPTHVIFALTEGIFNHVPEDSSESGSSEEASPKPKSEDLSEST